MVQISLISACAVVEKEMTVFILQRKPWAGQMAMSPLFFPQDSLICTLLIHLSVHLFSLLPIRCSLTSK